MRKVVVGQTWSAADGPAVRIVSIESDRAYCDDGDVMYLNKDGLPLYGDRWKIVDEGSLEVGQIWQYGNDTTYRIDKFDGDKPCHGNHQLAILSDNPEERGKWKLIGMEAKKPYPEPQAGQRWLYTREQKIYNVARHKLDGYTVMYGCTANLRTANWVLIDDGQPATPPAPNPVMVAMEQAFAAMALAMTTGRGQQVLVTMIVEDAVASAPSHLNKAAYRAALMAVAEVGRSAAFVRMVAQENVLAHGQGVSCTATGQGKPLSLVDVYEQACKALSTKPLGRPHYSSR